MGRFLRFWDTGLPFFAVGREDLFYGYEEDNAPTPALERDAMVAFMDIARRHGLKVLVTDYRWTQSLVDDSYGSSPIFS